MAATETLCMACDSAACDFKPIREMRRPLGDKDVCIEVMYCGVCHSDLHSAAGHNKNVFTPPQYPFIPGHELAGVVVRVGTGVTKFSVGDHAGVGCMVDSCLECDKCLAGEEQSCKKMVQTYGAEDWSGRAAMEPVDRQTMGGYTSMMVVHERFTISIPKSYPLEKAGPVMCAGITSYEPLKKYAAGIGTRVGFIGLGGLGVMGVKIAKALGCTVTVVSRSMSKAAFAKEIGADHYIASGDNAQMKAAKSSLDLILNFVPAYHDYTPYVKLLAKNGKQVFLGLHAAWAAAMFRGADASGCCRGSFIGGIKNTQEVIELCDREKIYPETTVYPVQKLNEIFELLDGSNESGTRYVLDIKGSLTEKSFEECTAPPPELKPAEGGMVKTTIMKEVVYMKCFLRDPR